VACRPEFFISKKKKKKKLKMHEICLVAKG
jgi:hypothetical protein